MIFEHKRGDDVQTTTTEVKKIENRKKQKQKQFN
jgi:hypothetical protein